MTRLAIDLNRGVQCCREKQSGTYVYMYIDTPGVYLSELGEPLTEDFARSAGFDVEKFRKERQKAEKLAAATKAIEAELGDKPGTVLREAAGYKLMALPLDRAEIVDPDGHKVTEAPLSTAAAKVFFQALVKDAA